MEPDRVALCACNLEVGRLYDRKVRPMRGSFYLHVGSKFTRHVLVFLSSTLCLSAGFMSRTVQLRCMCTEIAGQRLASPSKDDGLQTFGSCRRYDRSFSLVR